LPVTAPATKGADGGGGAFRHLLGVALEDGVVEQRGIAVDLDGGATA
jgi:hypothetical protein